MLYIKRKTNSDFVDELKKVDPTIKPLESYISARRKIQCRCETCGNVWAVTPTNLLSGKGCPKCVIRKITKTHKEFLSEIKSKHPNIKILGEYINNRTMIKCECLICGHMWQPIPTSLIQNHGCPECAKNNRIKLMSLSHQEFLERMGKINDNIEILSEYINTDSYVKCRCKIDGHEWETRAKQLLDNHGCPLCGGVVPKAHSKFVEEVSDINSDIEICGEYVNAHTKVLCRCKICDTKWYVTPHGLIDKRTGCPSCRNSQGERRIKRYLDERSINYISQKTFDGLCGVGGGNLSYDFYLPSYNMLIEYNGVQHEEPVEYFGGSQRFEIQLEHDERKRIFAKDNSMHLLEIWHYDYEMIDKILQDEIN